MNAKFDERGNLLVKRAGEFKLQECPDRTPDGRFESGCGDWCPRLNEFEIEGARSSLPPKGVVMGCTGEGITHSLVRDERPQLGSVVEGDPADDEALVEGGEV